jgi:hypothetical protein
MTNCEVIELAPPPPFMAHLLPRRFGDVRDLDDAVPPTYYLTRGSIGTCESLHKIQLPKAVDTATTPPPGLTLVTMHKQFAHWQRYSIIVGAMLYRLAKRYFHYITVTF